MMNTVPRAPLILLLDDEQQVEQAVKAINYGRFMKFVRLEMLEPDNLFRLVSSAGEYLLILGVKMTKDQKDVCERFGVYYYTYRHYKLMRRTIWGPSGAGKTYYVTNDKTGVTVDGDTLFTDWPKYPEWWNDQAMNEVVNYNWVRAIKKWLLLPESEDKIVLSNSNIPPVASVLPFRDILDFYRDSKPKEWGQPTTTKDDEWAWILKSAKDKNVPIFNNIKDAVEYVIELRSVPSFIAWAQQVGSIIRSNGATSRSIVNTRPYVALRKLIYSHFAGEVNRTPTKWVCDLGCRGQNVRGVWELRKEGINVAFKGLNIIAPKSPILTDPPDPVRIRDVDELWELKYPGQEKLSNRMQFAIDVCSCYNDGEIMYNQKVIGFYPKRVIYIGGSPGTNFARLGIEVVNVDPRMSVDCYKHIKAFAYPSNVVELVDKYIVDDLLIMDDVRTDKTESGDVWWDTKIAQTHESVGRCRNILLECARRGFRAVSVSKFSVGMRDERPATLFYYGDLCIQVTSGGSMENVCVMTPKSKPKEISMKDYKYQVRKWRSMDVESPGYSMSAMSSVPIFCEGIADYLSNQICSIHTGFQVVSNLSNVSLQGLPKNTVFNFPPLPMQGKIDMINNDGYTDVPLHPSDVQKRFGDYYCFLLSDAFWQILHRMSSMKIRATLSAIKPANLWESDWRIYIDRSLIKMPKVQTIESSMTLVVKRVTVGMSAEFSIGPDTIYALRVLGALMSAQELSDLGITEIRVMGLPECPLLVKYKGKDYGVSISGHMINMSLYQVDMHEYFSQIRANLNGTESKLEGPGLWHNWIDYLISAYSLRAYTHMNFNISLTNVQNIIDFSLTLPKGKSTIAESALYPGNRVTSRRFMSEVKYLNESLHLGVSVDDYLIRQDYRT
jgi:hypothetical protein